MNPDRPQTRPPFLVQAQSMLAEAGFATQETMFGDAPGVLAENDWFAVGIIGTTTLDEAAMLEPSATAALTQRLSGPNSGGKRWDAYIAILIEEPIDLADEGARQTFESLQYNTRGVRRLVSSGVLSEAAVESALRPLLPLPQAASRGLPEPFEDLVRQLVVNGVGEDEAELAVRLFRESGGIDDA